MVQVSEQTEPQNIAEAESSVGRDTSSEPAASASNDTAVESLRQAEGGSDNRETARQKELARLFKNKPGHKKILILTGVGAPLGLLVLFIVAIVLFFIGLLKIPNLAANITDYEFTSVTRQFAKAATRLTQEELAVRAAREGTVAEGATADNPKGVFGELKAQYQNLRDNTWGKFDRFRPDQVIKTLGRENNFKINVKTSGITGRQVLQSIELDGEVYPVKQVTGIARWVPVVQAMLETNNQSKLYATLEPKLIEAMDAQHVPQLIRGAVLKKMRSEMGITLRAWILAKFSQAKDAQAARLEEARQKGADVDNVKTTAENAVTEEVAETSDAAVAAERETLQELPPTATTAEKNAADALLQKTVANQGMSPAVEATFQRGIAQNLTTAVIDFVDPLFGVAIPVCIIYDGSVQHSGPSIDNNSRKQIAALYYVSAAADTQKSGDADSADLDKAIGATNADLGDTSKSMALERASGQTVDTTANGSAETGSGGAYYYDLFNALGVPQNSPEGKTANWLAGHICGALTDTKTAAGLGLLNLIAIIISFGGTGITEEALGQAGRGVVELSAKDIAERIATRIFATTVEKQGTKYIERTFLNRLGRFVFRQGLTLGATVGATELMNLIVAARANLVNSGLAQGTDLADMAAAGGNVLAQETQRSQLFGRTFTNTDTAARDSVNTQQLAYETSQKSFSERYFALSNPRSLFANMIVNVASMLQPVNGSQTLLNRAAYIFRPLDMLGSLMNLFGVAHAAPDPTTQHFGNVQFGWSEAEEKLIDSNYSYLPLQNQQILDQSGKEDEIAAKYAVCFGYDFDPSGISLDPSDDNSKLQLNSVGSGSIGNLLSNGLIQRDDQGRVIYDDGDIDHCSPVNLGVANPRYGDLVFRWRLAMQYDTTMGQLSSLQAVTNN